MIAFEILTIEKYFTKSRSQWYHGYMLLAKSQRVIVVGDFNQFNSNWKELSYICLTKQILYLANFMVNPIP